MLSSQLEYLLAGGYSNEIELSLCGCGRKRRLGLLYEWRALKSYRHLFGERASPSG